MTIINSANKRLFFALWPEPQVRQQCAELMGQLGSQIGQEVALHNLHVTLVFLGAVPCNCLPLIKQGAENIDRPDITLSFNQLSFWPQSRVVCLTTTWVEGAIQKLVYELTEMVNGLGIMTDHRPFVPHVTLFRKAVNVNPLSFEPIIWQASSFGLVESCQINKVTRYQLIARW